LVSQFSPRSVCSITDYFRVWSVINALDGRVFSVGSKGMGEGVEAALVEVAMKKGNLSQPEAEEFWKLKKEAGQYIAETW
jgi:sulfite reductase alpha subunit-like flavoprotein